MTPHQRKICAIVKSSRSKRRPKNGPPGPFVTVPASDAPWAPNALTRHPPANLADESRPVQLLRRWRVDFLTVPFMWGRHSYLWGMWHSIWDSQPEARQGSWRHHWSHTLSCLWRATSARVPGRHGRGCTQSWIQPGGLPMSLATETV